ncbi:hypothetical protein [Alkalihalobacillus deserti]|uniref:hypothetical protein n=1 Tax=Alkalihalobacillus deserti TaxID=2879466 RepID=UPI001D148B68|nr:hypothetical protein [Alkalihalobacillus deserti]
MKKWIIGFGFILLVLICCNDNGVNEAEVLSVYDNFFYHVTELFAYHTFEDEVFYNEKYHTIESIHTLLNRFMTDEGIDQIVDDLYMKENERLVYRDDFQIYLGDSHTRESSYYDITRQTVFNPGLRMVRDELNIEEVKGEIELTAVEVPVQFYSEESNYGISQFGQLGYPAVDRLSLKITMVKDNDEYRIQHVEVQS